MPKIKATTQQHLDIADIGDDLIVLKDGAVVMVLQPMAINFDLLSEREQDAMIAAYSRLLNSLSFPIQVVILSRKMDISSYLERLHSLMEKQENDFLKERIGGYIEFVKNLVSRKEVLDKRFYLSLRHKDIALVPHRTPLDKLLGRGDRPVVDSAKVLPRAKEQLTPRRDHLLNQLEKIGIKTRQLTTQELVELFYDLYNPGAAGEQPITQPIKDYTTAMVEPAVEG